MGFDNCLTSSNCRRWRALWKYQCEGDSGMIAIGLVLLLIGLIVKISAMWIAGLVIVLLGSGLLLIGITGRKVAGRRYWY